MARCLNCMEELPERAKFCPHCGFARPRRTPREQAPLPFSPWGPPKVAMQPSGAGAISQSAPLVGPPLTLTTVLVALAAVMLCLLIIIFVGRGGRQFEALTPAPVNQAAKPLPTVGMMGEPLRVGNTTWGVAFIDDRDTIKDSPAQAGQYITVGIVIGNRGESNMELSPSSLGLVDEKSGVRYTPVRTAWGTPDDIREGRYSNTFTLPPKKAIAGLIIFDVPKDLQMPRLLIRDLTQSSTDFTGEIDLTREIPQ